MNATHVVLCLKGIRVTIVTLLKGISYVLLSNNAVLSSCHDLHDTSFSPLSKVIAYAAPKGEW